MGKHILAVVFIFLSISVSSNETDSLLSMLEQTMLERHKFDAVKEQKIAGLKSFVNQSDSITEKSYMLISKLITEYIKYNFDSTLFYTQKNLNIAKQLNNASLITESTLTLCGLLSSSGRYKEATDLLNRIKKDNWPNALLVKYYTEYSKAYTNLSFHTTLHDNTLHYKQLADKYADSLLLILDENSEEYLSLAEEKYRMLGHLLKSRKVNSHRMAIAEPGSATFAKVTYDRAQIYRVEHDFVNYKKYLALSAMADIKASVKDNASLADLALLLNSEGIVDKAYQYINFAMEDVMFFNSSLRFLSMSTILPIITEDYQRKSDKQKANLRKYLIFISILLVILLGTLIYIYRQVRVISVARNDLRDANKQLKSLNNNLRNVNNQLNTLNTELSESNHVKEQYIGSFLNICSNYIDKLDGYRKMVNRQISNRKVDELFAYTRSKQLIDVELKEFYTNFDNTFLSIYPNFVEGLNALLLDEEQIVLKKGELLNTELRIFALIRLGIADSSKIAKLLRYSVNTIYNYRVKIKNKAAGNRDNFESLLMQIDACKS